MVWAHEWILNSFSLILILSLKYIWCFFGTRRGGNSRCSKICGNNCILVYVYVCAYVYLYMYLSTRNTFGITLSTPWVGVWVVPFMEWKHNFFRMVYRIISQHNYFLLWKRNIYDTASFCQSLDWYWIGRWEQGESTWWCSRDNCRFCDVLNYFFWPGTQNIYYK